MTIEQIKAQLGVSALNLNWFTAEDGTVTKWLREWNNAKREAYLMHEDVDTVLQSNLDYDMLDLKTEVKEGAQGPFTNYVIIAVKPADRKY